MKNYDISFFLDEIRNGFYIPSRIKQAWAAEMQVLSLIDEICRRHKIRYYADWGSLLATVRHGGFIPWDDDLDIAMRRDDFDKFMKYAKDELPAEFMIQNYKSKRDHWYFISKVTNSTRINFDEKHLETYHNFPWIANVDIFLLDYLYEDEEQEKERCDRLMHILSIAELIIKNLDQIEAQAQVDGKKASVIPDPKQTRAMDGPLDGNQNGALNGNQDGLAKEIFDKISPLLNKLEDRYGVELMAFGPGSMRKLAIALYELADSVMAEVPAQGASKLGQIYPWGLKGSPGFLVSDYGDGIELHYEDGTMPLPVAYNKVVASKYGNFMEIHKIWGGHNYPFFNTQRKNFEESAGIKYPEYEIPLEIPKKDKSYEESMKAVLSQARDYILSQLQTENFNPAELQDLAIMMGELLENDANMQVKRQKRNLAIVEGLENFCESLYLGHGQIESFEKASLMLDESVLSVKTALFLITKGKLKALMPYIRDSIRDGYDVTLVNLPIFEKDCYGQIKGQPCFEDLSSLKEEIEPDLGTELRQGAEPSCGDLKEEIEPELARVSIVPYEDYKIGFEHPDLTYTAEQYDEANPVYSIPQDYYTSLIVKFTDQLILLAPSGLTEFGPEDLVDYFNLSSFVKSPGFVYADKILTQSENMKKQYLTKLRQLLNLEGADLENLLSFYEGKLF